MGRKKKKQGGSANRSMANDQSPQQPTDDGAAAEAEASRNMSQGSLLSEGFEASQNMSQGSLLSEGVEASQNMSQGSLLSAEAEASQAVLEGSDLSNIDPAVALLEQLTALLGAIHEANAVTEEQRNQFAQLSQAVAACESSDRESESEGNAALMQRLIDAISQKLYEFAEAINALGPEDTQSLMSFEGAIGAGDPLGASTPARLSEVSSKNPAASAAAGEETTKALPEAKTAETSLPLAADSGSSDFFTDDKSNDSQAAASLFDDWRAVHVRPAPAVPRRTEAAMPQSVRKTALMNSLLSYLGAQIQQEASIFGEDLETSYTSTLFDSTESAVTVSDSVIQKYRAVIQELDGAITKIHEVKNASLSLPEISQGSSRNEILKLVQEVGQIAEKLALIDETAAIPSQLIDVPNYFQRIEEINVLYNQYFRLPNKSKEISDALTQLDAVLDNVADCFMALQTHINNNQHDDSLTRREIPKAVAGTGGLTADRKFVCYAPINLSSLEEVNSYLEEQYQQNLSKVCENLNNSAREVGLGDSVLSTSSLRNVSKRSMNGSQRKLPANPALLTATIGSYDIVPLVKELFADISKLENWLSDNTSSNASHLALFNAVRGQANNIKHACYLMIVLVSPLNGFMPHATLDQFSVDIESDLKKTFFDLYNYVKNDQDPLSSNDQEKLRQVFLALKRNRVDQSTFENLLQLLPAAASAPVATSSASAASSAPTTPGRKAEEDEDPLLSEARALFQQSESQITAELKSLIAQAESADGKKAEPKTSDDSILDDEEVVSEDEAPSRFQTCRDLLAVIPVAANPLYATPSKQTASPGSRQPAPAPRSALNAAIQLMVFVYIRKSGLSPVELVDGVKALISSLSLPNLSEHQEQGLMPFANGLADNYNNNFVNLYERYAREHAPVPASVKPLDQQKLVRVASASAESTQRWPKSLHEYLPLYKEEFSEAKETLDGLRQAEQACVGMLRDKTLQKDEYITNIKQQLVERAMLDNVLKKQGFVHEDNLVDHRLKEIKTALDRMRNERKQFAWYAEESAPEMPGRELKQVTDRAMLLGTSDQAEQLDRLIMIFNFVTEDKGSDIFTRHMLACMQKYPEKEAIYVEKISSLYLAIHQVYQAGGCGNPGLYRIKLNAFFGILSNYMYEIVLADRRVGRLVFDAAQAPSTSTEARLSTAQLLVQEKICVARLELPANEGLSNSLNSIRTALAQRHDVPEEPRYLPMRDNESIQPLLDFKPDAKAVQVGFAWEWFNQDTVRQNMAEHVGSVDARIKVILCDVLPMIDVLLFNENVELTDAQCIYFFSVRIALLCVLDAWNAAQDANAENQKLVLLAARQYEEIFNALIKVHSDFEVHAVFTNADRGQFLAIIQDVRSINNNYAVILNRILNHLQAITELRDIFSPVIFDALVACAADASRSFLMVRLLVRLKNDLPILIYQVNQLSKGEVGARYSIDLDVDDYEDEGDGQVVYIPSEHTTVAALVSKVLQKIRLKEENWPTTVSDVLLSTQDFQFARGEGSDGLKDEFNQDLSKNLFYLLLKKFGTHLMNSRSSYFQSLRHALAIDAAKKQVQRENIQVDQLLTLANDWMYGIEGEILPRASRAKILANVALCAPHITEKQRLRAYIINIGAIFHGDNKLANGSLRKTKRHANPAGAIALLHSLHQQLFQAIRQKINDIPVPNTKEQLEDTSCPGDYKALVDQYQQVHRLLLAVINEFAMGLLMPAGTNFFGRKRFGKERYQSKARESLTLLTTMLRDLDVGNLTRNISSADVIIDGDNCSEKFRDKKKSLYDELDKSVTHPLCAMVEFFTSAVNAPAKNKTFEIKIDTFARAKNMLNVAEGIIQELVNLYLLAPADKRATPRFAEANVNKLLRAIKPALCMFDQGFLAFLRGLDTSGGGVSVVNLSTDRSDAVKDQRTYFLNKLQRYVYLLLVNARGHHGFDESRTLVRKLTVAAIKDYTRVNAVYSQHERIDDVFAWFAVLDHNFDLVGERGAVLKVHQAPEITQQSLEVDLFSDYNVNDQLRYFKTLLSFAKLYHQAAKAKDSQSPYARSDAKRSLYYYYLALRHHGSHEDCKKFWRDEEGQNYLKDIKTLLKQYVKADDELLLAVADWFVAAEKESLFGFEHADSPLYQVYYQEFLPLLSAERQMKIVIDAVFAPVQFSVNDSSADYQSYLTAFHANRFDNAAFDRLIALLRRKQKDVVSKLLELKTHFDSVNSLTEFPFEQFNDLLATLLSYDNKENKPLLYEYFCYKLAFLTRQVAEMNHLLADSPLEHSELTQARLKALQAMNALRLSQDRTHRTERLPQDGFTWLSAGDLGQDARGRIIAKSGVGRANSNTLNWHDDVSFSWLPWSLALALETNSDGALACTEILRAYLLEAVNFLCLIRHCMCAYDIKIFEAFDNWQLDAKKAQDIRYLYQNVMTQWQPFSVLRQFIEDLKAALPDTNPNEANLQSQSQQLLREVRATDVKKELAEITPNAWQILMNSQYVRVYLCEVEYIMQHVGELYSLLMQLRQSYRDQIEQSWSADQSKIVIDPLKEKLLVWIARHEAKSRKMAVGSLNARFEEPSLARGVDAKESATWAQTFLPSQADCQLPLRMAIVAECRDVGLSQTVLGEHVDLAIYTNEQKLLLARSIWQFYLRVLANPELTRNLRHHGKRFDDAEQEVLNRCVKWLRQIASELSADDWSWRFTHMLYDVLLPSSDCIDLRTCDALVLIRVLNSYESLYSAVNPSSDCSSEFKQFDWLTVIEQLWLPAYYSAVVRGDDALENKIKSEIVDQSSDEMKLKALLQLFQALWKKFTISFDHLDLALLPKNSDIVLIKNQLRIYLTDQIRTLASDKQQNYYSLQKVYARFFRQDRPNDALRYYRDLLAAKQAKGVFADYVLMILEKCNAENRVTTYETLLTIARYLAEVKPVSPQRHAVIKAMTLYVNRMYSLLNGLSTDKALAAVMYQLSDALATGNVMLLRDLMEQYEVARIFDHLLLRALIAYYKDVSCPYPYPQDWDVMRQAIHFGQSSFIGPIKEDGALDDEDESLNSQRALRVLVSCEAITLNLLRASQTTSLDGKKSVVVNSADLKMIECLRQQSSAVPPASHWYNPPAYMSAALDEMNATLKSLVSRGTDPVSRGQSIFNPDSMSYLTHRGRASETFYTVRNLAQALGLGVLDKYLTGQLESVFQVEHFRSDKTSPLQYFQTKFRGFDIALKSKDEVVSRCQSFSQSIEDAGDVAQLKAMANQFLLQITVVHEGRVLHREQADHCPCVRRLNIQKIDSGYEVALSNEGALLLRLLEQQRSPTPV